MNDVAIPVPIALLGGTGRSGPGLARHFANAGLDVVIGSRDAERAVAAAHDVAAIVSGGGAVTGATNEDAARRCALAFITVPHGGIDAVIDAVGDALDGKVVVSTVVPMEFIDGNPTLVDFDGLGAAQRIAALLPRSRVTAALHTVSSRDLASRESLDADTVITGDDAEARDVTAATVATLPGLRPVIAGPLRYSRHAEAVTVLLIGINRRHKVNAGIRITHV